ncbi:MAG: CRISPR-associated endonuclease Cas1 [Cytophagales bacterium]|nr:CRISPR-associated endonuclease Cas1 [Bernardetiaceae bacterium]MDW8210432.1 CRISPR-associated endonuclease Cas1 [Cytophagales bacterium]
MTQIHINTFGASVHRVQGSFEIITQEGKTRISPEKIRSLVISSAAHISSDAILLAIEHEIEILFTDRRGQPIGRVWSYKYGSISTIRKQQVLFSKNAAGGEWVKDNGIRRIKAQQAILKAIGRDRPAHQNAIHETIARMEEFANAIAQLPQAPAYEWAATLRGYEGNASKLYFEMLSDLLPEQYQFKVRTRRPAQDIFNAALNYLYGILYGNVEGALIKAGIDPYLGVLHADEYNRPVLAFDMIERYRHWAEAVLMQICFRRLLLPSMAIYQQGGWWMENEGKRLLATSFNDYLNEVITHNNKRRTRLTHIQEDANQLAQQLLKMDMEHETQ